MEQQNFVIFYSLCFMTLCVFNVTLHFLKISLIWPGNFRVLSVCLSVCLSIYLSIYLSISIAPNWSVEHHEMLRFTLVS
jgi:hypothetical protein